MLKSIVRLYVEGFANMTLGKILWKIIFIKLLIMFIVLKLFIYGDSIRDIGGAKEQSEYVLSNLIQESGTRAISTQDSHTLK